MPRSHEPARDRDSERLGAEALLGLAAGEVPSGLCVLDVDGTLAAANAACTTLTGLAAGDRLIGAVAPSDRDILRCALDSLQFASEATIDITVELAPLGHATEERRHVRIVGAPLTTDESSPLIACSLVDMTAAVNRCRAFEHDATHDTLTGLFNRSAIEAELANRLETAFGDAAVAVLFLDLDGFKDINDAYGHQAGDRFLTIVADRLRENVRASDAIGRLGGDEFLVVISDDGCASKVARELADRLLDEIAQPISFGPSELRPRVSIGIAVQSSATTTGTQLLADADLAMYEAKSGGGEVSFASARTRDAVNLRVAIERDLGPAMAAGEIDFHFQVIRRLDTKEPLGAEALVRWRHPTLGPIAPPQLIERAEAVGLIADFTVWGLDTVCRRLAQLRRVAPLFRDKGFGVNATIRQLALPGYVDLHLSTIERHGLRAQDVIVEVTEYEAVGRGGVAEATIGELARHGVPIALDDFGVGYSALDYLTRLPIDVIKVDRSLIAGLAERPLARVVLQGLVAMAADLGFETLAEGIETTDELTICEDIGMRAGQGYLLGRPKPIDEFEESEALWTPGSAPDPTTG